MTSFGEAVKLYFTRAFDFQGRSTRAEYWWVFLFYLLVIIFGIGLIAMLGGLSGGFEDDPGISGIFAGIILIVLGLFLLICIIPSISLAVRRFHDLNQTGWLVLVFYVVGFFIPFGGLIQLIWFCFPGTVGPNQYGEDPYDDFFAVFE